MTKNKIYDKWAYTSNEEERKISNSKAFKELQENYKILRSNGDNHVKPTQEYLDKYDFIYSSKIINNGIEYIVYKYPKELNNDEIALICDMGNLCMGYSIFKKYGNGIIFQTYDY